MSETTGSSRVGMRIGPYHLLRLLGRGGMGEVYEAEDTVRGRIVALKLMTPEFSDDVVFRKRLAREARSAGKLNEPHVVPIHDFGEIEGQLFVDMRLINGVDLSTVLRRGALEPARAVAVVRQIASALDAAHGEGVMHRDVKPGNILVAADDFACLVDFGIANAATDEKLTSYGDVVGTYAYMSPERLTGDEDKVTYRADIYALACVLYECLIGSAPYQGSVANVMTAHITAPIPRPSAVRPGTPQAFDEVVARGMAKDPDERHGSAGEFAMAAHRALTTPDQDRAVNILNATKTTNIRVGTPPRPARGWATPPTRHAPGPGPGQANSRSAPPSTPPPPPPAGGGPAWLGQPGQSTPHQVAWPQPVPAAPERRPRKGWLIAGAAAAVAGVLVVLLVLVAIPDRTQEPAVATEPQSAVGITVLDDAVEVGNPDAPVTIDVFDEPICPPCGEFVNRSADDLARAVAEDDLIVRYHLVNFLDDKSSSRTYSTRAIAASLCVADAGDAGVYQDFYHGLFASNFQPKEGAVSDRDDTELADLAEQVGAPEEVRTCIAHDEMRSEAKSLASAADAKLADLGAGSTPAAYEGSRQVDTEAADWVEALG